MQVFETVRDFMDYTANMVGLNRSMMTVIGTPSTVDNRGKATKIVSVKLVAICKQKNSFEKKEGEGVDESYSCVVSRMDGTQPMRSYMSVKNAEYILGKAEAAKEAKKEFEIVTIQAGVFLASGVFAATDDSERASLFSKTLKFIMKYKIEA